MHKLLENVAHCLVIKLVYIYIYYPHGFKAKSIYIIIKIIPSLFYQLIPKPEAIFFEYVFFWVRIQGMCLHTFQRSGSGTVSAGKTAPSLQSTKHHCFGAIPCHSASHRVSINIYVLSKWNSLANKHWCFLIFQYFMSSMQKLDRAVTGNIILFSSSDLEFNY